MTHDSTSLEFASIIFSGWRHGNISFIKIFNYWIKFLIYHKDFSKIQFE